jgi:hypothetical protein
MTNENTKPADEMKDVAAGNVPHPYSQSSPPSVPGDPSINTPGATIEVADLSGTAAGNVPHPYSQSSPQSVPGDPSINTPGATIEVADLNKAAAGVNASADASPVGTGDPISDPPYNPQPGRHHSGSDAG